MTIINLKDWATERGFSKYHINKWIKDGLRVISQRPYTTTEEELNRYFRESLVSRNCLKKASKKVARIQVKNKKLDYRNYIREEYK